MLEHQIRSVPSALSSLLQNSGTQLDDESLRTLMCEAEAIVNSRPLTVNQLSDPNSHGPLTPNHLLTLKSKVVLSPPGAFQSAKVYSRKRWRRVQIWQTCSGRTGRSFYSASSSVRNGYTLVEISKLRMWLLSSKKISLATSLFKMRATLPFVICTKTDCPVKRRFWGILKQHTILRKWD